MPPLPPRLFHYSFAGSAAEKRSCRDCHAHADGLDTGSQAALVAVLTIDVAMKLPRLLRFDAEIVF